MLSHPVKLFPSSACEMFANIEVEIPSARGFEPVDHQSECELSERESRLIARIDILFVACDVGHQACGLHFEEQLLNDAHRDVCFQLQFHRRIGRLSLVEPPANLSQQQGTQHHPVAITQLVHLPQEVEALHVLTGIAQFGTEETDAPRNLHPQHEQR